jgi:septum site-determining protein MinD
MRHAMVQSNDMMSVEDILEILSVKLIGVIPEDEQVIVSTNKGEPLVLSDKSTQAGKAYENTAQRLEGKEVEFIDLKGDNASFFGRLKRWLAGT